MGCEVHRDLLIVAKMFNGEFVYLLQNSIMSWIVSSVVESHRALSPSLPPTFSLSLPPSLLLSLPLLF
jgi:hypothetical protein